MLEIVAHNKNNSFSWAMAYKTLQSWENSTAGIQY